MRVAVRVLLVVALVVTFQGSVSAGFMAATPLTANSFPKPAVDESVASARGKQETAVLSGGCFWGVQAVYQHTKGVVSATSGYAGGNAEAAHYEQVGTGNTGHAESVKIVYDPAQITYGQILMIFFSVAHNPTELNRQGPDTGAQYRSAIFPANAEQARIAEAYIGQLSKAHVFDGAIVTKIEPDKIFYPAEAYHQDFLVQHPNHPYIAINDLPKLGELKRLFPEIYRSDPVLSLAPTN